MIKSINTSSYRPLVIIPVYNHHEKISDIVRKTNKLGLSCLLLDDGSHSTTQAILSQSIAENKPSKNSNVENTLICHKVNRGKGAVVCEGILYAQQHHYTHALQIDADGQHDLNDIPKFLAESHKHPDAIISGQRSYAAMPPGRRYGRMVTDVWAAINTLSLGIKDSMCGYRLYPVLPTANLIKNTRIGSRMDFDTDIIIRLFWQGLPVHHIRTEIIYSNDISSNFDLWSDNIRISKMHARLFFGMLIHMPKLLFRKFNINSSRNQLTQNKIDSY